MHIPPLPAALPVRVLLTAARTHLAAWLAKALPDHETRATSQLDGKRWTDTVERDLIERLRRRP